MSFQLLAVLVLLSSLSLGSQAVNNSVANSTALSIDEKALWKAITMPGASTFTLTNDIVLSADLPPLPHMKKLLVQSANVGMGPFKIDGQNKYKMFRNTPGDIVHLTLRKLVVTRALFSAVELSGNTLVYLGVDRVTFSLSPHALFLSSVNATITNSAFYRHSERAVVINVIAEPEDIVLLFVYIYGSVHISNSQFINNSAKGAISVLRNRLIVTSCTFDGNSAGNGNFDGDGYGGAINFLLGGVGIVESCQFRNNKATRGGAISVYSDTVFETSQRADFTATSCTFDRNSAVEGGAIWLDSALGVIKLCRFRNNMATTLGGAISFSTGSVEISKYTGDLTLTSSTFDGNSARNGGALSLTSDLGLIKTCQFRNNKATASGGAIFSFDSYAVVYDSNFFYNSAVSGGGAVCIAIGEGDKRFASPSMTFNSVSFQRNTAMYGGAFILEGNGTMGTFCNSSFWRNAANGTINNGYGRVEGNTPGTVRLRPVRAISGMVVQPRTVIHYSPFDCKEKCDRVTADWFQQEPPNICRPPQQ